jgi:type I restriction enzyme R subunit
MTPAEQAAQKLETPFSTRRRQRGGRNVVQVSSNACELDSLRDRIRSQSCVKRVLFLADRTSHVLQAERDFRRFLPDCTPVNLVTNKG